MSESVLTVSESLLPVPESAGHASFRSYDHSDPLYLLQLDACVDWNADTGATSHMTHWLHNYAPKRVPIKLADNKTVYSAGEGIVYFNPIIDGKAARTFGFTRVLHVPDLRNNLLSVLFLTQQKGFTITIDSSKMSFKHPDGIIWFTATISDGPLLLWQSIPLQPPLYLSTLTCGTGDWPITICRMSRSYGRRNLSLG